jgi:hypothetical protein
MTAFLTSILATVVLVGGFFWYARQRPPGKRLTWGEAFVAAALVFLTALMVYGVVPDKWLRWADGELKWRSDKIGIPLGPFYKPLHDWLGIGSNGVWAPNGLKFFGVGKIILTAEVLRDIIATVIYGVGLGLHGYMWLWWQKRGKKAEKPALEKTSAYGRPLVRGS